MAAYFIDVIIPISIQHTFTYSVTKAEYEFLEKGMRVAVSFGKVKMYTALVFKLHQIPPEGYQTKDILQILDEIPIVTKKQLQHWEWISNYYLCSLGDVYRAAMPSAFLLESETIVFENKGFDNQGALTDEAFLIYEALKCQSELTLDQVSEILGKKNVLPTINELIQQSAIHVKEEIYKKYKPKLVKYIRLHPNYFSEDALEILLSKLSNAKKQRAVVLSYFQLASTKKAIKLTALKDASGASWSVIKVLVDKHVLELYHVQTDRVSLKGKANELKTFNKFQAQAFQEIQTSFKFKEVTLLHGVTSSGKTAIYTKLIQETLDLGKQVLFMLPEIALTTQIVARLQHHFDAQISVFHSKYTMNERVETWNHVLDNKSKAQIILGARSSLFLPFKTLGLIVIDEEHETSYKQFEPSPRYHARDAAIVLARLHQAKLLLGSATPTLETYFNATKRKYGFVSLNHRFTGVQFPEIQLIDIKEKHRARKMTGHFSDTLMLQIQKVLDEKQQVILFQNRRGFSPIVECSTCGVSVQCPNCDVSLTFHKFKHELNCHYCNYRRAKPNCCEACGSTTLDTKGFGTEQIELEMKELFPTAAIGRMDSDTTRGKDGYQKIITAFESREVDVLVGTQMLSKGLDFKNVSLVGVLSADSMLNFPDFRAHERAFQLMVQVSGRAGRAEKQGKVLIQTYNPNHQILQQVASADYKTMFKEQLNERFQYHYPPYNRLIKVTLKHKDYQKVEVAVHWLTKALQNIFKENVLGPSTPSVSRIRNQYIKNVMIKIPPKQSLMKTKKELLKVKNTFQAVPDFRTIRLIIDVDPY